MSSETVDWLKKVSKTSASVSVSASASGFKSKLSFNIEEGDEPNLEDSTQFTKPKANAIYSSKDLTGLQVAHDLDSFQAGQSDILVLADKGVLDDDGEEALVSMSLKEDSRLKRLREVARHAKGYSGFKAYEEETADSVVTLGGGKNRKILEKYDFAASEFNDEPGLEEGFRIGSVKVVKPENTESSAIFQEFDTVQSAGIDTLNFTKKKRNVGDLEKEQKRARKLAKTLFADEPEMMIEPLEDENIKSNLKAGPEEDDDNDMQRIIAATRREHLKTTTTPTATNNEEIRIEPKFIGGKSFDTLIMSESIFNPIESEEAIKYYDGVKMEDIGEDSIMDSNIGSNTCYSVDFNANEPFSAEPLVRDGVASTLALLNMRGINLQARGGRNDKSKQSNGSDIKLEYFDQFGNKLTSKEAYKELSRKFHGKEAGKGKLEKMKRRREETLKSESVVSSSESAIVTNLRRQQEETGAPYMILSSTRQQQSETFEPAKHSVIAAKKPKIFGLQLKDK